MSFVVLGAGVTGLTIAYQLLKTNRLIDNLHIISDYFPNDADTPPSYASTRAGGHWRPIANRNAENQEQCEFEVQTYQFWTSETSSGKSCLGNCVKRAVSYDFYSKKPQPPWYRHLVEDFEELGLSELPEGSVYGVKYSGFLVNCPQYIKYLLQEVCRMTSERHINFNMSQMHISCFDEIHESYSSYTIINCTSHSNRYLNNDPQCLPIRGQVVLVDAPDVRRTITNVTPNGIYYVIPRPGGEVVLGGTHWMNCHLETIDPHVTEDIKQKTTRLCPELGLPEKLKVLGVSVGLRPGRESGPCIERANDWLIHAYGVGGGGFQMSIGIANKVIRLIEEGTRPSKL